VVAPRVGQIPELVREGETGLLYAPDDASALGDALTTLIDDPDRRRSMGESARKFAVGRSWGVIVRRILELAPKNKSEMAA